MFLHAQVVPPSKDTSIGPFGEAAGVGMNTLTAMMFRLVGLTAMYGSLLWRVSSLKSFGMISTIFTWPCALGTMPNINVKNTPTTHLIVMVRRMVFSSLRVNCGYRNSRRTRSSSLAGS
jgi:hypothetical protein